MSETIFSNSLIFQEFAKLKYTLSLKISKLQDLNNAKISRPKVIVIFNLFNVPVLQQEFIVSKQFDVSMRKIVK